MCLQLAVPTTENAGPSTRSHRQNLIRLELRIFNLLLKLVLPVLFVVKKLNIDCLKSDLLKLIINYVFDELSVLMH